MQGGGDSDTVSVLSQHHSLKPELEVTGPQDSLRTISEAPDSKAAKVRKVGFPCLSRHASGQSLHPCVSM